ncbi:hypothetical protein C2G38_2163711 [Gigaspora rosea]|uniref:Uncharacterized protein n=1 Tax=Gigaspora rosea TaxID=44941 RepID=A0A397VX06_9GLOM|nr:hypothetical protein C2G38_2163711 [Gigaspora rosea]
MSKGYYFWKKRQHKRFSKQKQPQEKQQLYQQRNGIVKSISSLLIENNYYFSLETWTLIEARQDPPEIDKAYIRKGKSQVVECKVSDLKLDEARYRSHSKRKKTGTTQK